MVIAMLHFLLFLSLTVLPSPAIAQADKCEFSFEKLSRPGPVLPVVYYGPVGKGSTKPGYYIDKKAVRWIGKKDSKIPELQTANEMIASEVYRALGYRAPHTSIADFKGRRLALIEELGFSEISGDLAHVNTPEFRELRIFSAWLKDWDRLNSLNNFKLGKDGFAIFDFGGTLGSTAKGIHKPGEPFSQAVGTFENNLSGKQIFENFRIEKLAADHAWNQITREDALSAAKKLRAFSDNRLAAIVDLAQYSRPKDTAYMFSTLKQRRNALADYLERELAGKLPSAQNLLAKEAVGIAAKALAEKKLATGLIKESKSRFEKMFADTSGFPSVDAFRESIKRGPKLGAEIMEKIENGGVEIAIYRKAGRRESIASRGLLNTHSTATSGGQNAPRLRNRAEADMLGVPYKQYKSLPEEVKPKSALLQPKPGDPIERVVNLMYGEDAYIMNDKVLGERITWTPEDSLNRYLAGTKVASDNPTKSFPATNWDQLAIPWDARALATPYLLPDNKTWNKFNTSGNPYFFAEGKGNLLAHGAPEHFRALFAETPNEKLNISKNWAAYNQNYLEVQIWGPVNLDDVKAFQFSSVPPEGEFLEALLKRNIEIRDARDPNPSLDSLGSQKSWSNHPIKIWKPGMD
jgi:hypothetical protein